MNTTAIFVLLFALCMAHPIAGQETKPLRTLKQKLNHETEFKPKAEAALDQLIEAVQTFEIPMGIEWSESTTCTAPAALARKETVRRVLNDIVRRCPGYRLAIEHGVVHIYSPFAHHPNNLLNLRLWRFEVKQGNVIDASFELRLGIDMELHPEKFRGGWNGGYGGYPSDEVLAVPNITISAKNIRVRDALDRVIKSNGKALWLVRLKGATLDRRESLANIYKTGADIERVWEILPLKVTRQP